MSQIDEMDSYTGVMNPPTKTQSRSPEVAHKSDPVKAPEPSQDPDPDDPESLLAALEAEIETENEIGNHHPSSAREAHAQAVATEARAARQYRQDPQHATEIVDRLISLLTSDDALLSFTTQHARCLVLFAHPDFARCAVMEEHLRRLVARHGALASGTAGAGSGAGSMVFARVPDVRSTPFVVEKLAVRVLPCVIGFVDGVAVGRIVGFEGLGLFRENVGDQGAVAVTRRIEEVVVGWKVFEARTHGWEGTGSGSEDDDDDDDEGLGKRNGMFGNARRGIQGPKKSLGDDEDDDDWN